MRPRYTQHTTHGTLVQRAILLIVTVKGLFQVNLVCLLILIDCDWNKILNCTQLSWRRMTAVDCATCSVWCLRIKSTLFTIHTTYTSKMYWTQIGISFNGTHAHIIVHFCGADTSDITNIFFKNYLWNSSHSIKLCVCHQTNTQLFVIKTPNSSSCSGNTDWFSARLSISYSVGSLLSSIHLVDTDTHLLAHTFIRFSSYFSHNLCLVTLEWMTNFQKLHCHSTHYMPIEYTV